MVINNIIYNLEHLGEIIKDEPDPLKKAGYFGVLFESIPTFTELTIGTPKLAPSVELNLNVTSGQELAARLEGVEPPTSTSATLRSIH